MIRIPPVLTEPCLTLRRALFTLPPNALNWRNQIRGGNDQAPN
jgi:hypothetical protein